MTRNQTTLALCFAFVLGCIAGPMASQTLAPAHAQQSLAKKPEQFCSFRRSVFGAKSIIEETNKDLQEQSAAGWELVSASIDASNGVFYYCFRR
jgi:hypothetical protein